MKHIIISLLISIISISGFAQDLTIQNVSTSYFVQSEDLVTEIDGKGYFSIIIDTKTKKGYKLFNLYIWDYDLKELGHAKIELPKKSVMIGSVFNGNNFIVGFFDYKSKTARIISYDESANKIGTAILPALNAKAFSMEELKPSLYAAGEDGFYAIVPKKEEKFGYTIVRYDNALKQIWKKEYYPPKGMHVVMDAKSDNEKFVVLKYFKKSKNSKRIDIDLHAFDSKTGKDLWSYDLNTPGKILLPSKLSSVKETGTIALGGMFFLGEDKIKGSNSDGVFFLALDKNGKELGFSTTAWKGDLQRFIRSTKSSFVIGKPKVVFQDIIYSPASKNYQLVAEVFVENLARKVMSLMNNNSNSQTDDKSTFYIEDFIIFDFKENGDIENVYEIEKANRTFYIDKSYAGSLKIANKLKAEGAFSYEFYVQGSNENEHIIIYPDYVKKMGLNLAMAKIESGKDPEVTYLPFSKRASNKNKSSDVEFDSRRSRIGVVKSKPGFILIAELNRKEKVLNLFLEEIPELKKFQYKY